MIGGMRIVVGTPPDENMGDNAFDGAVGWTCLDDHSLDVEFAPGCHLRFDGGTWSTVRFDEDPPLVLAYRA